MKIRPLHDRVIVKRLEEAKRTASGIVIPENASENPDQGQVKAVRAGQSQEVRAIAGRAQNRLNYRFKRLSDRSLHRNKVVVAVARELCGFIWELHQQVTKEITAKVAA